MREDEKSSLLEKLKDYGETDFYPFHMPGHKRREMETTFDGGFPNPYSIDITEIAGFDNLHHAEGILKESMKAAANIYGADQTYYLVNGSSCGILSAICGTTTCVGKILMARNCHISAYHGMILNRLVPEYLYPETLYSFGINGGICPEDVEQALAAGGGEIQAVFIVSPTYEGIVSDVKAIAEAAHAHGIPLIVDEAHGAHLSFGPEQGIFPQSALQLGADIVIQSLHKTLPSFTQTAVMHVKSRLVDQGKLKRYLRMFQSSSPSYLFMAGIERCIRYMDGEGRREMVGYQNRLRNFYDQIKGLRVLQVLDRKSLDASSAFHWDPSKIVVSTAMAKGFHGEDLDGVLRSRYHLEMEMCAPEHVIAMTSLMDTEEGFLRLSRALLEVDQGLTRQENRLLHGDGGPFGRAVPLLVPSEALDREEKLVALTASAGMISREFVFLYPPGIPILVPGEQISEEILSRILSYKEAGLPIQGPSDSTLSTILTVA